MPWPLEETVIEKFAENLEKIIVVEEKRSIIETQVKEILFNKNLKVKVVGKKDENSNDLFVSSGALDPGEINNVIDDPQYASELKNLKEKMLSWYQETCDVVPLKGDERNFN